MLNEPGMERNHLEEGNHLDRGARRSARGHLRRVRCQAIPHHVVEPDQGRRRLAVRSLAGRPQGAARRERQQWRPRGRRARRATQGRTAHRAPQARKAPRGSRARKATRGTRATRVLPATLTSTARTTASPGLRQGRYQRRRDRHGGLQGTDRHRDQWWRPRPHGLTHKTVPVGQSLPGRHGLGHEHAEAGAAGRLDRPVRQPATARPRRRSRCGRSASPACKCR